MPKTNQEIKVTKQSHTLGGKDKGGKGPIPKALDGESAPSLSMKDTTQADAVRQSISIPKISGNGVAKPRG